MQEFIQQEYIYLIGPTAVLSLALAAVAVSYVFLLIRLGKSEKDKVFLQSKLRDSTIEILREAHEKRLKIIQEAVLKAGSIIKDAQTFDIDVKNQIVADLQVMRKKQEEHFISRSDMLIKLYSEFEQNMRQESQAQFIDLSKKLEIGAYEAIKEFKQDVERQRLSMNKQIQQKLQEEYKTLQSDIEEYKNEQLKKIDKRTFDILQALTRDVLGRSLTLRDHEELVQKALSQLKVDIDSEV